MISSGVITPFGTPPTPGYYAAHGKWQYHQVNNSTVKTGGCFFALLCGRTCAYGTLAKGLAAQHKGKRCSSNGFTHPITHLNYSWHPAKVAQYSIASPALLRARAAKAPSLTFAALIFTKFYKS
jgi:hypothetical protein